MHYIKLLRVKQWVKNLFLFIPLYFGGHLMNFEMYFSLIGGFFAFSLIASSIYILNDYVDVDMDRLHPKKCKRPLASGAVSKRNAIILMIALLVLGLGLGMIIKPKFLFILSIYLILNLLYSLRLKNIPILDMIIVAVGFNLRIKSGGIISEIPVSEWLMVMVFLLALFMAIAKRRDDIVLRETVGMDLRKVSSVYNLPFLNSCISVISGVIIVAYLMYTFSPDTILRFSTYRLYYTSIFVIAGLMRYMQITFVDLDSGSPTSILYRDKFIQATLILWAASFYVLIYFPDINLFGA